MPSQSDSAKLIACKVMDPFVPMRLLEKNISGATGVRSGALQQRVDLIITDIAANDKEYSLHMIDFIFAGIKRYAKDAGFRCVLPDMLPLTSPPVSTISAMAIVIDNNLV